MSARSHGPPPACGARASAEAEGDDGAVLGVEVMEQPLGVGEERAAEAAEPGKKRERRRAQRLSLKCSSCREAVVASAASTRMVAAMDHQFVSIATS